MLIVSERCQRCFDMHSNYMTTSAQWARLNVHCNKSMLKHRSILPVFHEDNEIWDISTLHEILSVVQIMHCNKCWEPLWKLEMTPQDANALLWKLKHKLKLDLTSYVGQWTLWLQSYNEGKLLYLTLKKTATNFLEVTCWAMLYNSVHWLNHIWMYLFFPLNALVYI